MTDFGNFQFGIQVDDRFSSATQRFRDELRQSQLAWRQFRDELARGGDNLRDFQRRLRSVEQQQSRQAAATRRRAQEQRQASRDQLDDARRLDARLKERARIERELGKAARQRRRDEQKVLRQVRRAGREQREQGEREAAASQQRLRQTRDVAEAQQRVTRATRRSARQVSILRREFGRAAVEGRRLSVPLGRFLTVAFAISGIRRLVNGFRSLVSEAVAFNANIESSQLGIAGLLTAVGEIRNSFGESANATEALALAGQEADRQIRLLQQDALNTVATFDQLVDTFQIAIAPGLTAGLDVNEVRTFTVQISQAAAALGVAQNQLAEEIRSILAGTIQARTTRIATALGITNEDIRRAREAGTLVDFLNDRFQAFGVAGREALNTFTGLQGRLADITTRVTGLASVGLFDELKAALRDIFDILTARDDFGILEPDPQVVEIFQTVADALQNVVSSGREALAALDFESLLESAQTFAVFLERAGEIVIGFAQGAIRGFTAVGAFLEPIVQGLSDLVGNNKSLRELAATFAEVASVVGIIATSISLITALVSPIGLIGAALGVILTKVRDFLSDTFDVEATFADVARLIGIQIVGVLKTAGNAVKFGLNLFALGAQVIFLGLAKIINVGIIKPFGTLIATAGAAIPKIGSDIAQSLFEAQDATDRFIETMEVGVAGTLENARKAFKDTNKSAAELRGELTKFFTELATRDLSVETGDAAETVERLGDRLIDIPPFVSTVRNAFVQLGDDLAKINEESRQLSEQLMFDDLGSQLTGTVGEIGQIFDQTAAKERELSRNLSATQTRLRAQLLQNARAQQQTQLRVSALNEMQVDQVRGLIGAQQQLAQETARTAQLKGEEVALQDKIRDAAQSGRTAEARALQEQLRGIQSILVASEDRADLQREFIDLAAQGVDPFVVDTARQIIELEQERSGLVNDINAAKEQQSVIERTLLELANRKANVQSERAIGQQQVELQFLNQEVTAQQNILDAVRQRGVAGAQQLAEAQNRTQQARLELQLSQNQRQAEIDILRTRIAQQAAAGLDVTAQEELLALLVAQKEAERTAGGAALQQLEAIQERARLVKEGSITEGLTAGLTDVAESIGSEFQAGVDIATQIVNRFSSFVADSLVSAFDPSSNFDIREQFARFLQDIARLVIQKLTEIAIAKAILGLGLGAREGGTIPAGDPRAQPSLAHYTSPQGLARGGKPRPPRGVDRRDTVPIWAQPGEFMLRKSAVDKYPTGFIEALNAGKVSLGAIRDLASGLPRVTNQSRRRVPSFQTGGLVNDAVRSAGRAQQDVEGNQLRSTQGVFTPVVVADEQSFSRMIRGGESAYLRFTRENRSAINANLGQSGRGI